MEEKILRIRMPAEVFEQLQQLAAANRRSPTMQIVWLIEQAAKPRCIPTVFTAQQATLNGSANPQDQT